MQKGEARPRNAATHGKSDLVRMHLHTLGRVELRMKTSHVSPLHKQEKSTAEDPDHTHRGNGRGEGRRGGGKKKGGGGGG